LHILIADDDVDAVEMYRAALESKGHIVATTLDGKECMNAYGKAIQALEPEMRSRNKPFDAVILDYKMPFVDGLEVAKEIIRLNPHQRIIFASAYVKETLMDMVKELSQVTELIQKPFEPDVLVDLIEDTDTASQLGDLNQLLEEMAESEASETDQVTMLMQRLKKIQKDGSI
jgi:CheY-like chemotaxis protein